MAKSPASLITSGRQHTVDQSGAPEPETNEKTIWLGRQPGEGDAAPEPAAEQPAPEA